MDKKICKDLLLLLIFIFYIMSLKATYILALTPLEIDKNTDKISCNSIVILGGRDDYDRILKGLELAHEKNEKILIVSGVSFTDKNIINKFGLSNVIFDDNSTNTYENAQNTKKLLDSFEDVCLVSSQSHLYRASKVFEKLGMNIHPIVSNENKLDLKLHHLIPDLKYFVLNISVIYEYLALIQYAYQERI